MATRMGSVVLVGDEPALVDALRVAVAALDALRGYSDGSIPDAPDCSGLVRAITEARDAATLGWVTLGRVAGDVRPSAPICSRCGINDAEPGRRFCNADCGERA